MAKYREIPCLHYVCKGQCKKGMEADHKGHCQHCGKYEPRARVQQVNKKKQSIRKEREKDLD